ncbi:MAG: PAS domain-containing protein [Proteobacteria bacterium]|nr:PAS domain-containing protein [Pseudomonadota bacterium]
MLAERLLPSAISHFDPADLIGSLATGVVVLDADLCVVYANIAAQDLLAASLNQSRGRPFVNLLAQSGDLPVVLRRALLGGESLAERELTIQPLGAGGEQRVIDLTVMPLDTEETRGYLLLEISDATQRRRIARDNDLLARLDGSRQMVRQLAHEIKNPLGGLRGAAQLLERELAAPELREYTAVIIREADRLTALVDSMLGPARVPHKSTVNIHELCEHVFRLMQSEAPSGVRVERDYDPSLPDAELDQHQIIQAILNIGRNALQAVGTRGQIVLRTRVLGNVSIGPVRHRLVASIAMHDDGPGVPPEIRDSLFYPLVTGRSNGTGLGLALSQELVTRHGGLIEYVSRPGATVFTILLPLAGKQVDHVVAG